ncbi:related to carboxypeptidase Y-sorting protein PEP1 precursor [Fusarium fujikuroi IMI 58289]|uniref:Vacuolar protein sorting/targeting protein 10 n=1 Tax=Gibberella fujikuroi (strain CBS 195.34 / IMI 58289 / NRRL A-6831) TaxID=1279085 RepID=S0DJ99_GIBF5|nr:related to carboxypeptidase Y-sorting protein PEP1 precursor [Fusarium fujikuroi IMI 58289]KLP03097.1 carboxypeptidase Y-sorting protein PEP1 precursor [Fusarium fujikuroi]CCT62321.1 related to carboxypeptidase Y-sorting protein PEP1 precursor [Fusarium fujikuroi IMI 58289]
MMRSSAWAALSWRALIFSLLWTAVAAKQDKPTVDASVAKHPPLNLNYFEDSDVVVFQDIEERNIWRSEDAGKTWAQVPDIPDRSATFLYLHPFDSTSAFVLTKDRKHYKTEDRGKSWSEFNSGTMPSAFQPDTLVFHAGDPKRIIFNGMNCDGIFCDEETTYTIDGFKTVQQLRPSTSGCWWAKTNREFTTGDAELDKTRILCIVTDPLSLFKTSQKLCVSDNFFAKGSGGKFDEFEPSLDGQRDVTGVVSIAAVKSFILLASSSAGSDEMTLFVTSDAQFWHRAMFPTDDSHDHSHKINQEAYTVLESTNYSIQVDVMTSHPSTPMGVIFTSNSNGTYFTENIPYTNRNVKGHVDFEKISGIQGIFLVNTVENGKDVDAKSAKKVVVTQITFDDGRTFEPVKAGQDRIHLHSMTDIDNIGRIFSSPAPGLVMGNGNTGAALGEFESSNLYVSDNAGVSWKKALEGPHKYEFGDTGGILVAARDSLKEDVDKISFSLDYGENWESAPLPDGLKVRPVILTTTQDSTSLKFLLIGEKDRAFHMIAINFEGMEKRTCESKDMESWYARVDDKGAPTCIMGHKQTYNRRKKSADCFLKADFRDPEPVIENCECTDADFECDYNFQRDPDDNKVCKKVGPVPIPEGSCKGKDETFKGSSGWRLIPGNTCTRKSGAQKDDPVERKCSDGGSPGGGSTPGTPASGEISLKINEFTDIKGQDMQKFYLMGLESESPTSEVVIARPIGDKLPGGKVEVENKLWITADHGKTWKRILEKENILGLIPHTYFREVVFFHTDSEKVIYTIDRGHSFHSFKTPFSDPGAAMSFHPDKKDWIIWIGKRCGDVAGSKDCYPEASISTDRGDNWKTLQRYATKCEFTGNSAFKFRAQKQIVCLVHKDENTDNHKTIVTIEDFSEDDRIFHNGTVAAFATMNEFILATDEVIEDGKESAGLQAIASMDGKHFEAAQFPRNFHDSHSSLYTVLDSSNHAVNLFVATDLSEGRRRGSIIKSNSNGTTYVLSAPNVNSDELGYVDFEKVAGLEGVTLINSVSNPDDKNGKKVIQTKISHNDGAEWGFLPPPSKGADGKSYSCSSSGDRQCALHLHHYTERENKGRTFSASTAVGLIFGYGNVGPSLGDVKEADTFMSADGGINWKSVKKGVWTWQYGDQGSIIVLAQRATLANKIKSNIVSYSTDEGNTWTDYKFTDKEVTIQDLTSVHSGTSRNFLVWYQTDDKKLFAANLDFTGLTNQPCKYSDDSSSDYDLWSPKHPLQNDDCLFGHKAKYLRKKTDRKCYNQASMSRLREYENCECTRRDFECAYNFELDNHGQCTLVPDHDALSGEEWCKQHPNETSYFDPTGYRRIPLTTCEGGQELDKTSTEHACAGHEEDFARKPAFGWYAWRNWSGKFGQIRLGDNSATFDSEQPWIKYPVIAISALAAVVAALPLVLTSIWRSATGVYERVSNRSRGGNWSRRYTTRDSFARGRGDYSMVDDDEGELLGEESDEEV